MVKFNIIGHGFLDVSDPSGVSFKVDNQFYRFCDISLGRSTEFTVPATERNRVLLDFGDDPCQEGEMLRTLFDAQMVYDGGVVDGTISVTSYDGNTFKCVFTFGNNGWVGKYNKTKIKDIALLAPIDIVWDNANVSDVDTDNTVQLARYDRDTGFVNAPPCPAVNVKRLIALLCQATGSGSGYAPGFENYWLVAGSMVGGGEETVTISTTAPDNMSVTGDSYGYFSVEDIDIEWGTVMLWDNGVIGGGSFQAKGLKASRTIRVTFPNAALPTCYVIKWRKKMTKYEQLAGPDINGKTIEIPRGAIIFFAATKRTWQGYQDTLHPFSVTADIVSVDGNVQVGDTWHLADNLPDMTFYDFLRSVALGTGNEVTIDPHDVAITQSEYGEAMAQALNNVLNVDSVARRVEAWGSGTKKARVVFDSEDYVLNRLTAEYELDNSNLDGEREFKCAFSEGGEGVDGIQINDYDGGAQFIGKKWTLAYGETGDKFLQRVGVPSVVAYDDLAANSTAMRVKVLAPLSDFIALNDPDFPIGLHRLFLWRGASYVWTDASWSDGVLTMTMQKVSQAQAQSVTPPPALVSIHASFNQGGAVVIGTDSLDDLKQYLTVTAYYDDSSSRVLADGEYTLSGTLAYPSATITVDCQGETDTFTVAVAYDAKVAYIESTGTQYINTGIKPDASYTFDLIMQFTISGNQVPFGCRSSGTYNSNNSQCYANVNLGGVGNVGIFRLITTSTTNNSNWNSNIRPIVNTWYDFDGMSCVPTMNTMIYPITLFAFNIIGVINPSLGVCRIGAWVAYSNGIKLMDLIPVRCGTVGYMYDRVSGTLFGNDGTGDFIVGADV